MGKSQKLSLKRTCYKIHLLLKFETRNTIYFLWIYNIMVIQVYARPVMLKKLKLNGYMKTTTPFRTNTQKRYPFHYRGLECKSRKSRNTWSKRQIWPWSTKWSRTKANRLLPREYTGHSKHPLPTTQDTTTHGLHQMVNNEIRLIIFFAAKDREALYNQQKQD